MTGIEIISPADNTVFDIDPGTADTGPVMPTIKARATIVDCDPDPTPTTRFTWVIAIQFQCSGCTHGRTRQINDEFRLTSLGGDCTIAFPRVRGGNLTITASAEVPAANCSCTKSTQGLKIRGVNPPRAAVNTACGTVSLQKMVLQESGRCQFDADAETGASTCPLFSGDGLGGVGMLQITRPSPSDDVHWDWLANINRGRQMLEEKRTTARGYPAQVRNSAVYQQLVRQFAAGRKPPPTIVLPDFSADQLELDSIRGFNGWAGRDAFGNNLHEFRVPLDAAGNLQVTVNAANRGVIVWQRVPAADRPQATGDPNYVANVMRQIP
jgi:hypothetical protein